MTGHHGTHNDLHSEQGALPASTPGARGTRSSRCSTWPGSSSSSPTWPPRALRARVRVHHREPDGGRAPAARDRRRRALRDRAPWTALEVPRRGLPGRGLHRRGAARRRHRSEGREAAREHRRAHRGPDRPERGGGPGCRRHPRARRPAGQPTQVFNFGHDVRRANATQRPHREPAKVQRLGHVVLQTTRYIETLNWYLEHLGLIVSDFKYYEGSASAAPR